MDWRDLLSKDILPSLIGNKNWDAPLGKIIDSDVSAAGLHLGIFVEPFLSYIFEGKKTVESRFSIKKIAPYQKVSSGDVLLLKKSGGPVMGICQVTDVWYYQLDASAWTELKSKYAEALCAFDAEFWQDRAAAEYATLMRISHVQRINPVSITKRDRRGWIVMREPLTGQNLFH